MVSFGMIVEKGKQLAHLPRFNHLRKAAKLIVIEWFNCWVCNGLNTLKN